MTNVLASMSVVFVANYFENNFALTTWYIDSSSW